MRSPARWLATATLLFCAIGVTSLGAATARAAEAAVAAETAQAPIDLEELRKIRKARAGQFAVASRISRYLTKAAEASDEGTPEEALALLDRLNPKRLNPYERALVYRLKAYIAYGAGDFAGAIENFENVLKEEVLPLDDENKIRFNISQLYASLQQWPEVISSLERWFRYVEEPAPAAYYLRSLSYFQLGELDLAIRDAGEAIDLSPEPPEGWLQLLTALYVQKEDFASAAPVLEELVMKHPKKQYWMQLALIYGARDNYRESLAVQQVAYLQGFLTEDKELRRLARSYLYHDLPYPAAQVLKKGREDGVIDGDAKFYELLANSWIAAREYERSLPPLQQAAELSEDGNLYVRLGQVHLQREEPDKAAEYLQKALAKGSLKDAGNARLLLGIAYYNSKRIDQARSSFVQASQYESTRVRAKGWIEHIEREAQAS